MKKDKIVIKGAREHNLKNISLSIPRNKLTVVTGLSGSGKSSLAFDTIYAEGQRRYVESLSSYARQFLGQLEKPDVDYIEGLSPAVAIEQRKASSNPRSTVATVTEIYDHLRLLFARTGEPHCYKCGRKIKSQSAQEIVKQILSLAKGTKITILSPRARGRKGEFNNLFQDLIKAGFVRVRVDGEIIELDTKLKLKKNFKHNIEIVVDRLSIKPGIESRLTDSVETALKASSGTVIINNNAMDLTYSESASCPHCLLSFEKIEPRLFSFNSPYGACPECNGLGNKLEIDADFVVPDKTRSIKNGAILPWRKGGRGYILHYRWVLREVADYYDIDLEVPFKDLDKKHQKIILYGSDLVVHHRQYEGVIPHLERLFYETDSEYLKEEIRSRYMSQLSCPSCNGARLKPEALAITINKKSIHEIVHLSVKSAYKFFSKLELEKEKKVIARQIMKEILSRLEFINHVGLGYLTLSRTSATLSGGEAQRLRLATQIGSALVGVLYILDEPSIGLHQKDNLKLLESLEALRDLGNTLIVVEHDEATIRRADNIIDLGPGAGKHGGKVLVNGSISKLLKSKTSKTAQYLNGKLKIPVPIRRAYNSKPALEILGAEEHNLKKINVKFPLGTFICVTGVSGSGKSTLVDEILFRSLNQHFYGTKIKPGKHKSLKGLENIDKVIEVDQSPIGRTPRSNPATYTGVYSPIRELFATLPEAKLRGYKSGRFSFNVKGGRCEACAGAGVKEIEMHFLPSVFVKCEVCKGNRFNEETLKVQYKGKTINDILNLTVDEALELFQNIPPIRNKLEVISSVGMGYIHLGQPATTLSGGEAQRVKLSSELSRRSTGKTLYILDEPTTGLHFADVDKLLSVLQRLVDTGNTILVVEHNLDVIKQADYVIDLGPEGGDEGGYLVASGSPEEISTSKSSHTGKYLKNILP